MLTISLLTIAVLSCIGVLHSGFSDNLLQRIGLSIGCVGSVLALISPQQCPENSVTLLLIGVACYAIGTAKNAFLYRHHRRVKRTCQN